MNKGTGLIADIQRSSIHDGPGIRTTVFFKGCPLHCAWCHNPECISFEKQTLFYPDKCIGCGKCDQGCFAGAKVTCGKEYTLDALMAELLQDMPYYRHGGVTFSGGEPLAQREFLSKAVDACHEKEIHCAIETSLMGYDETVLRKFDLIMADLKIWDNDLHRLYTGSGNVQIKENFQKLNTLGIPIIARTPVIPEIPQQIPRISEFLKTLDNVKQYQLLPYHPLGMEKTRALGMEQPRFTIPTEQHMKEAGAYAFLR